MSKKFEDLDTAIDEFLWRAWVALGVRGTAPPLRPSIIDPEGLILMTAVLVKDKRLRDESVDWCARMFEHVSKTRLRNKSKQLSQDALKPFQRYCATVNSHSSAKWPTDDTAKPYATKLSGKSVLAPLASSATAWLRFRAIFGVTARADILLHLLVHEHVSSAAELAQVVGASKRNANATLDNLVIAGIVEKRPVRNRYVFSLRNPEALRHFTALQEFAMKPLIDWFSWTRHFFGLRSLRGLPRSIYRVELAKWAGSPLPPNVQTQDDAEGAAIEQVEFLMGDRRVKVAVTIDDGR